MDAIKKLKSYFKIKEDIINTFSIPYDYDDGLGDYTNYYWFVDEEECIHVHFDNHQPEEIDEDDIFSCFEYYESMYDQLYTSDCGKYTAIDIDCYVPRASRVLAIFDNEKRIRKEGACRE